MHKSSTLELYPLLKRATIDFIPEIDVSAGSVVVIGKLVGIAKFGIRAGSRGSITVRGVFDVVKDPTTNIQPEQSFTGRRSLACRQKRVCPFDDR